MIIRENKENPIQLNRQQRLYEAALAFLDAGISFLPIGNNKEPFYAGLPKKIDPKDNQLKPSWADYQNRQPTPAEAYEWFIVKGAPGLAVIGGEVSGNLEILDIEGIIRECWSQICEELDIHAPGIVERLLLIGTPGDGFHVPYRCEEIEGSQKLALRKVTDKKTGKGKTVTLIETKSEGGYVVTCPSSPACHPLNKPYEVLAGDWLTLPVLTQFERDLLIAIAKSFNEIEEEEREPFIPQAPPNRKGLRPGDDFNLRASWAEILESEGWTYRGWSRGIERWKRPGEAKWKSHASIIDGRNGGWFTCFSENVAGFEVKKPYYKFAAYTIFKYGSATSENFKLAARELAMQGYGDSIYQEEKVEREETAEKDAFNQVVGRMFAYWNITDKSFRTFIAFDCLTVGFKSKRLAGEDVARQIRTRFCEGKEENAKDFGNRRMRELLDELKQKVKGKIITIKDPGGKPLKWDAFRVITVRSITRYEVDRSIINEALALAERYVNEAVQNAMTDEMKARTETRARNRAAVEVARKYAKMEPAAKPKRKEKDAYEKETAAEEAFQKQVKNLVAIWYEMQLDPVTMRSRWGRLVGIGESIFQEESSSEARKMKRKGKKTKSDIYSLISPQKTASN